MSILARINAIICNVDRLWHLPIKTLSKHSNNLLAFEFLKNKWAQIPRGVANGVNGIRVLGAGRSGNNSQRITYLKPKHIQWSVNISTYHKTAVQRESFTKVPFMQLSLALHGWVMGFPLQFIRIPRLSPRPLKGIADRPAGCSATFNRLESVLSHSIQGLVLSRRALGGSRIFL